MLATFGAIGAQAQQPSPGTPQSPPQATTPDRGRDVHPPTGVVGQEVPPMKAPDQKKDTHPPTEIIGEKVPPMRPDAPQEKGAGGGQPK